MTTRHNVQIVAQRDGKQRILKVVNPAWNKRLNRLYSRKGGGHRAVREALQAMARRSMITRVKYQPSNGCWYAEATLEG